MKRVLFPLGCLCSLGITSVAVAQAPLPEADFLISEADSLTADSLLETELETGLLETELDAGLPIAEPTVNLAADLEDPTSDTTFGATLDATFDDSLQVTSVTQLEEVQPDALAPLADDVLSDAMAQVTSVTQLSDVQPTDWAFQAVQSLVERYGCIAGYPDGTFRGNRALTRYEFAAGLNACLDRINELIAAQLVGAATQDDLATIERLQQEFAAELATLRGRVDALDARTSELEANQFSLTTRLNGEAIIGVSTAFGEIGEIDTEVSTVLQNRVRLNFDSSFTGLDRLRTRFESGNAIPLILQRPPGERALFINGLTQVDTQEGRFTYDGDIDNNIDLGLLSYSFPIGSRTTATLFATGGQHHHYADTVNPLLEGFGGGQNAISRFSERNPIYRIGGTAGGAGASLSFQPADILRFDLGYLSVTAPDPSPGAGLFDGNYSFLGQMVVGDRFRIGLTYVHAYENRPDTLQANRISFGGTGTAQANLNPVALVGATGILTPETFFRPVVSNSYGVEVSLGITPQFTINGWAGKTSARLIELGDADIWNFAVGLALADLGREGSLAGLTFGAAPTLRSLDVPGGAPFLERDFAYQLEGFYRLQLNDNISVTPGVIWVFSPNQNANNDDVVVGTIRTTFRF